MEAVKAMIHDQDFPMHLWAEATRIDVYVQKKVLTMHLGTRHQKKCLQEKIKRSATYRYLVFPVYVHVPKDKRSKLDPSGNKGVFVGYSETSKAYRVYILGYRKIEISRDVTFNEDATFRRLGGII
jgi:hypothetical protein